MKIRGIKWRGLFAILSVSLLQHNSKNLILSFSLLQKNGGTGGIFSRARPALRGCAVELRNIRSRPGGLRSFAQANPRVLIPSVTPQKGPPQNASARAEGEEQYSVGRGPKLWHNLKKEIR